jgi:biopolymer transport protein ExbB
MNIFTAGGILLVPILLCGLFSAFIIIERFVYFHSIEKRDNQLKKDVDIYLTKHDYATAETSASAAGTPTGIVLKKAVQSKKLIESDMREVVQNELDSVVPMFERWTTLLPTLANVAMLLGLLGTVLGNISAFNVLGGGGSLLNQEALSLGIARSLVTTAAGLIVAIPTLVFNSFLNSIIDVRIAELEKFISSTLLRLTGRIL